MKRFIYIIIGTAAVFFPFVALAQVPISVSIPGSYINSTSSSPGGYIANFYQFALLIGGVLALGVVIYGGILYMTTVGNPSGQSDAKEWLLAALWGFLLLAGAYLVLYTINPQLVNLNLPSLSGTGTTANQVTGSATAPAGNGSPTTGCAGGGCQNLASDGFTCKPASAQPNHQESCSAAPEMADTLGCIESQPGIGSSDFTVTEAMPPTVAHESSCHQDGCCVDTALNNPTCAKVQALVNAAAACHATAANEYAGCSGGHIYPTTTGGNVHINSKKGNGC